RARALPGAARADRGLPLVAAHGAASEQRGARARPAEPRGGGPAVPRGAPRVPMTRGVTVANPVLHAGALLADVLAAARPQPDAPDVEVEILVVASGSTDGSVERARAHGAVVHEIPKEEFSHGGTRNLMIELARGDRIAFLTQDATPAHDGWLAALLEGF